MLQRLLGGSRVASLTRAPLTRRGLVASRAVAFHSNAAVRATKTEDEGIDFGSTDKVEVAATVAKTTVASSFDSVTQNSRAAKAQEDAISFNSSLPDHLYNHLAKIDLAVKPQPLDSKQLAELKAKLVAINQKIRTELAMQPSQFYHEYYTPDVSKKSETGKRENPFASTSPDFHPLLSDKEAVENENYLQSQGLNNDPHQSVFDLLGHELPKPLPKPEPCTFCRPPRDNPPEYYNIDYTNVNLLHRFLNARGMITHRRFNHNCGKHQRKVARAIKRARFIGLLSFTHLYHVPREFMKVPAPSSDEAARAEMSQALRDPNFAPRQTAANLPLDKLRGADFAFWTQDAAMPRVGGLTRPKPAGSSGAASAAAKLAAAKKRDPNSME